MGVQDVAEVVDVVDAVGLARKVARLAVVKVTRRQLAFPSGLVGTAQLLEV